MTLKLNINPSRRDFFKKIREILIVSALALVVFSPTKLQAQENKNKADGEPPKLSEKELNKITKESGLSIKKILALEKTIDKMMDHNKFSDYHPDNTDYRLHGGEWYKKDDRMLSPYDVDSALAYNEFVAIRTVSRGYNYRNEFYCWQYKFLKFQ